LAISLLFDGEQRFLDFLFDPEQPRIRKRAGVLRDEAWAFSQGEQLSIRVALDFWCGAGYVGLHELIETWDQIRWFRFLAAIRELLDLESQSHSLLEKQG